MFKKVQFNLTKIKYIGKSIGRNVCINIDILDKNLKIDKRIKVGDVVEFEKEIGSFSIDQKFFKTKVKIVVVEKDVLFNDMGSTESSINIDMKNFKQQKFDYMIELREKRFLKNWGKSIAKFEITIEASAVEPIKYIPDIGDGWLKVKMENGDLVSLPAFLEVQPENIKEGREYFKILEGLYKDSKASVSLSNENNNISRLLTDIEYEPSTHIQYSISKKKLIIGAKKYNVADYPDYPLEIGWYDIELPDYPHSGGQYYLNRSSRAKTWFRIGHEGERYLHTGSRSLGCVTVTEVEKWNEIYDKLIKARKGDFLSIGVLEVIK